MPTPINDYTDCVILKKKEDTAIAFRWKERGHWFDWTTDWEFYDKAIKLGFETQLAYPDE